MYRFLIIIMWVMRFWVINPIWEQVRSLRMLNQIKHLS